MNDQLEQILCIISMSSIMLQRAGCIDDSTSGTLVMHLQPQHTCNLQWVRRWQQYSVGVETVKPDSISQHQNAHRKPPIFCLARLQNKLWTCLNNSRCRPVRTKLVPNSGPHSWSVSYNYIKFSLKTRT